jgi:glycosyltransferase involved in cell wall biosynthesis
MPTRVLFLNTRDRCGADVAVHLTLMEGLAPDEAEVFTLSNSEAAEADEMRHTFAQMPQVRAAFLPFGRPAATLAAKNPLDKLRDYGPSVASLVRAASFIRRHHIQVLHATDRPRDATYVALLGRMTGASSVVHMHSNAGPHLSRPTLWGLRKATAIFAVSDFIRDSLGRMGFDTTKIHTLHNATDTCYFNPDHRRGSSAAAVRRQFGIPQDAPLAGITARLTPWKGQRELIGGAAKLHKSHPNLHILIVGAPDGTEQADYEALARAGGIADRVHFAGFQKDVRSLLEAFDLFVHPSYEEPFGLAITEAMAMRKPVIASASGGVPEIITHGEDGWLIEPRSTDAVAAAIATLLDNPERRRQLGERARETIRARFSPRRQCSLVAQYYAGLAAAKRTGSPMQSRFSEESL